MLRLIAFGGFALPPRRPIAECLGIVRASGPVPAPVHKIVNPGDAEMIAQLRAQAVAEGYVSDAPEAA